MKSAIELLRAARDKKTVKVEFEIPLSEGQTIKACLDYVDKMEIWERQQIISEEKYEELCQRGWDKKKIDQKKWEKSLKDTRETLQKSGADPERIEALIKNASEKKPENLARQKSMELAGFQLVQEIIPLYLKDPKGNLLFPSKAEQQEMTMMIREDMELAALLGEQYAKLSAQVTEIEETAKNLPGPENSENGSSGMQSPEDTEDSCPQTTE